MKLTPLLILISMLMVISCQERKITVTDLASMELPHWTLSKLEAKEFKGNYDLDTSINPFYLNLNLDGKDDLDIAVVIKDKASGRRGIAVLFNGSDSLQIFGAENADTLLGGNNWNWLIGWKGENVLTAGSNITKNAGSALILFTDTGKANWLYWDGKAWEWVEQ